MLIIASLLPLKSCKLKKFYCIDGENIVKI